MQVTSIEKPRGAHVANNFAGEVFEPRTHGLEEQVGTIRV